MSGELYPCPLCREVSKGPQAHIEHMLTHKVKNGVAVVEDIVVLGCRTLYGGPHPPPEDPVCSYCEKRKPRSPCPHCGRP